MEQGAYRHLEYAPLINPRAHQFGAETQIANPALLKQYKDLMAILAHKPKLDDTDELTVVYYLFLQDRTEEGIARFERIDPNKIDSHIQYDYLKCYCAFYTRNLPEARGIASKYAGYPVERWRKLFSTVLSQADEAEGKAEVAKPAKGEFHNPDREDEQGQLENTEPSLEFHLEDQKMILAWRNLPEVTLNFYRMEPEMLFSRDPFASAGGIRFSIIKPEKIVRMPLPADRDSISLEVPKEYLNGSIVIEASGGGIRKSETFYANSLKLQMAENYGRLALYDSVEGKPVAKAYVKVYARLKGGAIRFYKDGYTDLRGKFDYASLNADLEPAPESFESNERETSAFGHSMIRPDELSSVERLSLLIVAEDRGTIVREAKPPAE